MNIGKETFDTITSIAKKYGATQIILLGSALENPAEVRDIDLACGGVLGWKLFELSARLENALHIIIDLIPLTSSTRFARHIEAHGMKLL